MIVLSVNADETAPVPANISANVKISVVFSCIVPLMKSNSLYLFPKYLLLLIFVVLYPSDDETMLLGIYISLLTAEMIFLLFNLHHPLLIPYQPLLSR